MIHFIIGKRTPEFEKTLHKVLLSLGKDAESERFDASSSGRNIFDEIQTLSLFGDKKVLIISNLFEDEDRKKAFINKLEELSQAPNDAMVLGESLLAADVKKIEKFAEIHKVLDKEKKEVAFNPFVLANTFATGDKKKTWITFQQVLANSDEMEPTHGMIWWKLKDMMQKNSVFSPKQMRDMAKTLVIAYHESRLGGLGMAERLEAFFLTMPDTGKR